MTLFVQIHVKVFATHKRESDEDPGKWFAVVKLSGKQYKVVEVYSVVGIMSFPPRVLFLVFRVSLARVGYIPCCPSEYTHIFFSVEIVTRQTLWCEAWCTVDWKTIARGFMETRV